MAQWRKHGHGGESGGVDIDINQRIISVMATRKYGDIGISEKAKRSEKA